MPMNSAFKLTVVLGITWKARERKEESVSTVKHRFPTGNKENPEIQLLVKHETITNLQVSHGCIDGLLHGYRQEVDAKLHSDLKVDLCRGLVRCSLSIAVHYFCISADTEGYCQFCSTSFL